MSVMVRRRCIFRETAKASALTFVCPIQTLSAMDKEEKYTVKQIVMFSYLQYITLETKISKRAASVIYSNIMVAMECF